MNADNKFKTLTLNIGSKRCPSSATTYKWWTEKKKIGVRKSATKNIHRRRQPISNGWKEKFWVRKSDSKNMHRQPQSIIRGLKYFFGSENRTQKISIVGQNQNMVD